MRNLISRFLMVAVGATAMASMVATSAEASSRHIKKHHQQMSHHYRNSYGFNDVGATGAIAPVAAPSFRRTVCPGMGRSFDRGAWPPPFDEDPDRKVSGSGGG